MEFHDRTEAGRRLATRMKDKGVETDLVLAIPLGGLPIGREIADAFDAKLDIIGVSKVGTPANPELAVGAFTVDGRYYLTEETIQRTIRLIFLRKMV